METNKIKELLRNSYLKQGAILIVGLLLGWFIFGGKADKQAAHSHEIQAAGNSQQTWICSMHPQIRKDEPGLCPICAMDLTPVQSSVSSSEADAAAGAAIDPDAVQLSKEAVALANIQTTIASRTHPVKEIQLYGTIQADERLSQSQTSHVNGRIEKLHVNFTGERVQQGQIIATIYSPDLLSAQQELLEAAKLSTLQPALLPAAREKLRLWKLTDDQIAAIEQSGAPAPTIEIRANTSGIVVDKRVSQGDYITQGSPLFLIANLSQVWAMFDAYEVDLPFIKVGDRITFTLPATPHKSYAGRVSFIDPVLDKTTRTAKVRVETPNPAGELKPEMYAHATLQGALSGYKNEIVIPKSALLWTGKRSIVYVKQPTKEIATFALREITLGASLGNAYVILSGLSEGDEIVTNGAFTIDASAQLEGKRSMMNAPTDNHTSIN